MRIPRPFRIGLVAAGALALSGAVVAVTAAAAGITPSALAASSTPKPSPSGQPKPDSSAYCDIFISNLGKDLGGKSAAEVKAAIKKAAGETLDQAVKDGKLTADQAQKMKDRLAASGADSCAGGLAGIGRPQHGPGFGGPPGKAGVPQDVLLPALAATLNMTPDQVSAALKSGKSIHDLAGAGTTEADFKARLAPNLKSALDKAVAAQSITQAQADAAFAAFQNSPHLMGWERPQGGMRPPGAPGGAPAPTN